MYENKQTNMRKVKLMTQTIVTREQVDSGLY